MSTITIQMRDDWLTEVQLSDEAEPIVLAPGDKMEITPTAEVVVHREFPSRLDQHRSCN